MRLKTNFGELEVDSSEVDGDFGFGQEVLPFLYTLMKTINNLNTRVTETEFLMDFPVRNPAI